MKLDVEEFFQRGKIYARGVMAIQKISEKWNALLNANKPKADNNK